MVNPIFKFYQFMVKDNAPFHNVISNSNWNENIFDFRASFKYYISTMDKLNSVNQI